MIKREWLIIVAITVLGFIFRATAYFHYPLANDFAVHWQEAHQLLEGKTVLVGPAVTSQGERGSGFYQGPFYYYYLALLQLLTGSNDRLVVLLFGLVNSLAIIPFYFICRRLFSGKTTLLLAIIYAVNPYLVYVDGTPWNPNLIPALTVLSLWLSFKIKYDHHCEFLPTLYCLLAFISQCHIVMAPLILFFAIFTFEREVFREKLWLYLSSVLLFYSYGRRGLFIKSNITGLLFPL
ncbi:glycosyltransferase family 39 protein [bacterium]|nr:glycosyltransferase family 39 protein [bacterium]